MSSNNKSILKGGVFYFVYNIANIAFPFISGIYVAKILYPETIGEIAAAQNLAQYFIILAFLGIPTYGVREIAKTRNDNKEKGKVYSELFVINIISTCVFLIMYVVVVLSVYEYRENIALYSIVGVSIALNAFNNSWLYDGLEEFKFTAVRNIAFKTICFIILILFVRSSSDYLLYAAIAVFGVAGNYIVNMLYAPRFVRFSIKGLNFHRHLKPIFFLVAVNLAIELYSLVDITMMNFMCGKESIAYYKYGSSIQKMLLQIVNTFTMVIVPRLSLYYKEKRKEEFNYLVSKGFKLIILFAIPMIIGIFFTSDFLIQKMYGSGYASSSVVLKYLSLLLLISPIGYLLGSRMLLVTGNESKMIIAVGIGAAVNVIGNALLIPEYQEYGATVASVLSEVVVMCVYVVMGKKYYILSGVKKTSIKTIIAGVLMAIYLAGCASLPFNGWLVLILQIIGSVVLYFTMLLLLKEDNAQQCYEVIIAKLSKWGK